MPKLFLPLFLLAAIGLTVYLAQQQTELTPSAQEVTVPTGCKKITPTTRSVCYKKGVNGAPEQCKQSGQEQPHEFKEYTVKEVTWTFTDGWKNLSGKGEDQADGDRMNLPSMPGRFDSPTGKSYEKIDNDAISGNGTTRDGSKISYRVKDGTAVVVEYAYTKVGTNFQGVTTNPDGTPATTYDKDKSYALVPNDESSGVRCDGVSTARTKNTGAACTDGNECKSGTCTNKKCDAAGSKIGEAACTNGSECQSGTCTNKKCAGGSLTSGKACNGNSECASNKCGTDNKCAAAVTSSTSPSKSASPKASGSTNASTAPGATATASASASTVASPTTTASPTPLASGATVAVSLTKAEITGFKSSYDLLNARLGSASASGNLKITATIAKTELAAIVSELPSCPDDSGVGPCLDSKFRTRFDFAKTAARLSAFYAIFNNISGICVKSDLGLNPLITASSVNNALGRVNLCTEPTAAKKLWRVFIAGKFDEILATDTRWPANPTCATLPTDVLERYRRAEGLFSSQANFAANTLCDGKTTVAPGN